MNKQLIFQVSDNTQMTERIIEYFTKSSFKLVDRDKDKLKFNHSSSFFDTWTTNPLKWGSEIVVSLRDNEVIADFCVDTESQMKSVEEMNIWSTFISNFKSYMIETKEFEILTKPNFKEVRKSRLIYIGWTIFGCILGGLASIYISKFTGNKTLSYFAIPIMATYFLAININNKKQKNAL